MKEFRYKKICDKCGNFFNKGIENTCFDCLKYQIDKDTQHNTTNKDNIIYNPTKEENFKSLCAEKRTKKDYVLFEEELLELIDWAKYCKISKARIEALLSVLLLLSRNGITKSKQMLLTSKDDGRDFYPVSVLRTYKIKKPKKISESKVNSVNEDTLYNDMVNNENFNKIKDKFAIQ